MHPIGFIIRIYHDAGHLDIKKGLYKFFMVMILSGYRTDLLFLIHVDRAHTAQSSSYTRILSRFFFQTLGITNQTSRPHNSPDFDVNRHSRNK